ncbi:MAG: hypothetical protein R6W91_02875, partial [Thermoplasmata archaeon]
MKSITSKIMAIGIVTMFLIVMFTVVPESADGAVLAANKTEIHFDGENIEGLKGFTYKVYKDRQDVRGIGMNERVGVVYGRLHVMGKILVHSNSELLDMHMNSNTNFEIVLTIMQDSYPEGLGIKQFTFDGCHVDDREFQIDSYGYALTTYTFTGDRIRAMDGDYVPESELDPSEIVYIDTPGDAMSSKVDIGYWTAPMDDDSGILDGWFLGQVPAD